MKRTSSWSVVVVCITLAVIAGVASVIVTFFLAALTGAGHGSGVPFDVYLAPFGLGMIALPMMILAIAVPRRWLYLSLAFVLMLLAVRIAGAGFVYLRGAHDLYRLDSFLPVVYGVWLATFVMSCICPICILVRIVGAKLARGSAE